MVGEIYSSLPGRADKLKDVMLDTGSRRLAAQIEQVWHHEGRPVFKFSGIDSISDAEPWAGADVLAPESEQVEPGEGEYSHADLIGCRLVGNARAGETGVVTSSAGEIGIVTGLEDYGGPSLLKVEAPDGREILVPFVRSICREIDVTAKIIRVDLPDGLLEL